jgi:hypothetical protein
MSFARFHAIVLDDPALQQRLRTIDEWEPFTAEVIAAARGVGVPGGGLAVISAGHPENVHIAYRGVDYQVEVYDPVPSRARALALSGDVKPIR